MEMQRTPDSEKSRSYHAQKVLRLIAAFVAKHPEIPDAEKVYRERRRKASRDCMRKLREKRRAEKQASNTKA